MAIAFPYWDLTWELVQRELRVRYRRSLIGFAWTMLQPMLMMGVLHIAFSTIFRFNVDNYPVYVLAGLLFWNFFSQSIVTSMNSLRANGGLIQKLPVPKSVFPLAVVISGVINLLLALLPLLALLLASPAMAEEVNVYSHRQPELIQPLVDAFTKETGIKVRATAPVSLPKLKATLLRKLPPKSEHELHELRTPCPVVRRALTGGSRICAALRVL